MSDHTDKPLRGPSRPLGFAVDDLDYIKPSDVEKVLENEAVTYTDAGVIYTSFGDKRVVVGIDTGSSDRSALQLIDTLTDHVMTNSSFSIRDPIPIRINYGRIPSKRSGRKGTRKGWKRRHPPKTYRWNCYTALPSLTGDKPNEG